MVADASRARMLGALMDGRALTATELAIEAEISPSTATEHLQKLAKAGLIDLARQGRHRYFHLHSPEVASLLESLLNLGALNQLGGRKRIEHPLQKARCCYDHAAGEYAVRWHDAFVAHEYMLPAPKGYELTRAGQRYFSGFGIDLDELKDLRRAFARPCLDWTERRSHLGGALGCSWLRLMLKRDWVRRVDNSRQLLITPIGTRAIEKISKG